MTWMVLACIISRKLLRQRPHKRGSGCRDLQHLCLLSCLACGAYQMIWPFIVAVQVDAQVTVKVNHRVSFTPLTNLNIGFKVCVRISLRISQNVKVHFLLRLPRRLLFGFSFLTICLIHVLFCRLHIFSQHI